MYLSMFSKNVGHAEAQNTDTVNVNTFTSKEQTELKNETLGHAPYLSNFV